MNTAPFFWLIAAVGFLVLEGCTFNMTSIWFAIGAAAALISCLFTKSVPGEAVRHNAHPSRLHIPTWLPKQKPTCHVRSFLYIFSFFSLFSSFISFCLQA